MKPSVLQWMSAVQSLMTIAPDVILFSAKVKQWISDMFSSNVITAEEQNALHSRVNQICADLLTGKVPDHWRVEADPE